MRGVGSFGRGTLRGHPSESCSGMQGIESGRQVGLRVSILQALGGQEADGNQCWLRLLVLSKAHMSFLLTSVLKNRVSPISQPPLQVGEFM